MKSKVGKSIAFKYSTASIHMGAQLHSIRKNLNMTQTALGEVLGVKQTVLSLVERGGANETITRELLTAAQKYQETKTVESVQAVVPALSQKKPDDNVLACWLWLADPKNFASSSVEYLNETYDGVLVSWYVRGFGWCQARGTSLETAILSAMNTTFNDTEYFPGKVTIDDSGIAHVVEREKVDPETTPVFYCSVTESEQGWGSRPDGYLLALTLDQFKARAKTIKEAGSIREYSFVDGEPKRAIVTPEMLAQLLKSENGSVWDFRKQKDKWFVRECE